MSASTVVAMITAVAGFIAAALTHSMTKLREREADWRKLKLEMHRECTTAIAEVAYREGIRHG